MNGAPANVDEAEKRRKANNVRSQRRWDRKKRGKRPIQININSGVTLEMLRAALYDDGVASLEDLEYEESVRDAAGDKLMVVLGLDGVD